MFTLNDNVNNLYIDKELFYDIDDITVGLSDDDKHYTVLAMLGALAMASSRMPYIFTSLDMILMTMADSTSFKATAKNRKGIMDGFNRLNERMITLSEPLKDDKKQVVTLDAKLLLHGEGNSFFQISRKELATIMTDKTPHHLAVVFCAMNSRLNMDSYTMFNDFGWDKYDYNGNVDSWKRYKYLSCYSTQEEFKTTWCSIPSEKGYTTIERIETWDISNRALTDIFNKLIDLGLVSRVIRNIDGKNNSYYCRPIHAQCIEELLPILDGQVRYAKAKQQDEEPIEALVIKEQTESQQPKRSGRNSRRAKQQPTEPKPFGIPRGGERKSSGASDLASLEHGCTSDANKKVHDKARARKWNNTIEHIETTGKEIEFDLTDLYIQPKCSEKVSRDKKW